MKIKERGSIAVFKSPADIVHKIRHVICRHFRNIWGYTGK
jgi:hypothetical protein